MDIIFFLGLSMIWLISSIAVASYAETYEKGSVFAWLIISLFCSPLIGAILIAGIPKGEKKHKTKDYSYLQDPSINRQRQ